MKSSGIACLLIVSLCFASNAFGELRAGATVVDVTPIQFPVIVNGGMLSRKLDQVKTQLSARALVLDDGKERLGIVVVDSCMMPRPFLDEVKQLASQRTKLKPDRILISATHTHSAPSCMGALGTPADQTYVPYLREKIAESLATAEANLEPARVGWAVADAGEYTALRRWIIRPDRVQDDPFGNPTVRATMHAGSNWDNVTGESGPKDPDLSLISLQSKDGRPIAVLANFSMHYFSGEQGLSADYFGLFCEGLKRRLGRDEGPAFVGIMSHGCSGDIWRRDYKVPPEERQSSNIDDYADGLLGIAYDAYQSIEYSSDVDLAMAEARLLMKYRLPDAQRLEWARGVVEAMGDREPKDSREVYAREQIILHERQDTEIVVQALRIGDIGITTTPNETYALTGLKLKLQSPLARLMVIELANGGDGYIPPPEQHLLGGYNTWAARSAGLEVQAEPRIVETALTLLEQVADKPRREHRQSLGPAAEAILKAKPLAYWRLDEFSGPHAADSSGNNTSATYEPAVAYFLEGPRSDLVCAGGEKNRATHFAGDRMRTRLAKIGDNYSVSLWFWNGMPNDARDVAGWICSRGRDYGSSGEHLGVGGTATEPGRLIYQVNVEAPVVGKTEIARWTWNHLVLVRDADEVRVYLNGKVELDAKANDMPRTPEFFFGGRSDRQANWEGRLDEIAVFDRALSAQEVGRLVDSLD